VDEDVRLDGAGVIGADGLGGVDALGHQVAFGEARVGVGAEQARVGRADAEPGGGDERGSGQAAALAPGVGHLDLAVGRREGGEVQQLVDAERAEADHLRLHAAAVAPSRTRASAPAGVSPSWITARKASTAPATSSTPHALRPIVAPSAPLATTS